MAEMSRLLQSAINRKTTFNIDVCNENFDSNGNCVSTSVKAKSKRRDDGTYHVDFKCYKSTT